MRRCREYRLFTPEAPERVLGYGHSAGRALAAPLGVRETRDDSASELEGISTRVDCVVALAAQTDITMPDTAAQYPDVFGGTPEEMPEVYRDASAVAFVEEGSVPFLLVHGVKDLDVPIAHSRELAAALEEAGVEVELVKIPDAGHDTANDWAVVGEHVLAFLDEQLEPRCRACGAAATARGKGANGSVRPHAE